MTKTAKQAAYELLRKDVTVHLHTFAGVPGGLCWCGFAASTYIHRHT